ENVVPPEIVAHLPVLCDEKKIPWIIVPDKKELGIAAGLTIPTSSVAILDEGEAKGAISGIIKKIETLRQNK
ncbi:MAG: ribosomal L7Ae/L30e/S12e/Gadd45 family protein, partial [archaeon]